MTTTTQKQDNGPNTKTCRCGCEITDHRDVCIICSSDMQAADMDRDDSDY